MGRALVRRRGVRGRRPIEAALDDPGVIFTGPPPARQTAIPRSDSGSPARARYVGLLLHDPAQARAERLKIVRRYWQARLKALERRLAAAERELAEAQGPPPDDDSAPPPAPAVLIWRLRCERALAWADVSAARARLEEIEQALGARAH